MTTLEICLIGLVCLNLYGAVRYRMKYKRARNITVAAVATAAKHEQSMAEAASAMKVLAAMCEKAGCDADVIRYRSLANRLQFGVGMAKRLEVL